MSLASEARLGLRFNRSDAITSKTIAAPTSGSAQTMEIWTSLCDFVYTSDRATRIVATMSSSKITTKVATTPAINMDLLTVTLSDAGMRQRKTKAVIQIIDPLPGSPKIRPRSLELLGIAIADHPNEPGKVTLEFRGLYRWLVARPQAVDCLVALAQDAK